MPAHVRAFDLVNAHAGVMPLFRDHFRQKADPHARCHQFNDEVDLAGTDRHVRREPMRTTCIKDDMIEGKAALEKNERQAGDIAQRNAIALCLRVIGREQRHNRFASHILPFETVSNRQKRSREFHIARQQQFLQPSAAVLDQLNVDLRIKLRIGCENGRKSTLEPMGGSPSLRRPRLRPRSSLSSANMSSFSASIASARRKTISPAAVSREGETSRSSRTSPNSSSSCLTALLTVDWVALMAFAAAEKPPCRTTSTNAWKLRKFMSHSITE